MSQIKITCETCHKTYEVNKTEEIPAHIFIMHCNWCPCCEDQAEDYWQEWWDEDENNPETQPIPVPDNQLAMPFIFDELGISTPQPLTIHEGGGATVSSGFGFKMSKKINI